jgi:hypothetical protein
VSRIILPCLVLALAACGSSRRAEQAADPYMLTRNDKCYTVDLFTQAPIVKPSAQVPESWRGFSGRWGGGAWAGQWCHDLYVLEIKPTGEVTVIDTHAPLPEWGKPATAFKRTARIDRDGRLRMEFGETRVEYWLQDGRLLGHKDEGQGQWRIAMVPRR